jgi:hypothetical protein
LSAATDDDLLVEALSDVPVVDVLEPFDELESDVGDPLDVLVEALAPDDDRLSVE